MNLLSLTFLANSQTLLGVLATLLVLCLFYEGRQRQHKSREGNGNTKDLGNGKEIDSADGDLQNETGGNNFLFRILHSEKEKIKIRIEDIAKKSSELKKELIKISDKIRNITKTNEPISRELKNKAGAFITKYEFKLSGLEISTLEEQYDLMNSIESNNEQFRAPLFCFSLSIILFCIDELWMLLPSWHEWMTVFCGFMTIISFVYWIIVWIASCFSDRSFKQWRSRTWFDFLPTNIGAEVAGLLLIALFSAISFWIIKLYPNDWYIDTPILLIILLIPVVLFGVYKMISCKIRGKYSYSHIIGHFFAMLVYSALLTMLIFHGNNKSIFSIVENSFITKPKVVSILAVGFVLFNGLLIPFLLPLLRYRFLLLSNICRVNKNKIISYYLKRKMKSESQMIMAAFGEEKLTPRN